jgi:site-specific recombinase XerD
MMLGHESLATTEIYLKVEGSRLSEIHRRAHPRGGGAPPEKPAGVL